MATAASTHRLVRLHLGLFMALTICGSGFTIEVLRALGGNTLSWAYVFEWPFLAGYALYLWHRLVVDERRAAAGLPPEVRTPRRPRRARARARAERREIEEAGALEAWNRYLRDVNAADRGAKPAP